MKKIPNIHCFIHDGDEHTIHGRLLGVCTEEEKNIIENNFKVAKRIFTKTSVTLSDVVKQMLNISDSTNGCNAGNLVIAIKSINKIESYTKKLLITSALNMILEEEICNDYSKIEAMCEDGSYLILKDVQE